MKGLYRCTLGDGYVADCYISDPNDISELITGIDAEIYSKDRECIGFFKGQFVGLAGDLRQVLFEMDGESQSLSDVAGALLLEGQPLNFLFKGQTSELFNLERLRIHRQHRGKKLGLQVCAATIVLAAEYGANFCMLKPFPLQWEGRYDQGSEERNEQAEQDFGRLTEYYKTLGFHDSQSSQGVYWLEIKEGINMFGFNADNWKLKKSAERKKCDSFTDFESAFA